MLKDPAKKYRLLLRLNNAIISQYEREGLFHMIAGEISSIVPYDRFSINLYNPKADELTYFAVAAGVSPEGINEKTRPLRKGSVAQRVILSRKEVVINDLSQENDLETAETMRNAGLNATFAYPMIVRGKILGTIHFSFRSLPPDAQDVQDFLRDLCIQISLAIDNMLSYERLQQTIRSLDRERSYLIDAETTEQFSRERFFYVSPQMINIMKQIELIASTEASVLITGETGTGKDHIARIIHGLSPRSKNLFVKVNCAALAPQLIESELFGHAKGAYTGADSRRIGRFELADKGTVFLDEIGEIPTHTQAKLLQALQEKSFERVGESTSVAVDFRLIAATNQNLMEQIRERTFRSDLYYRLNTIPLHIPPLRERKEDIALLVKCFVSLFAEKLHKPPIRITQSGMNALGHYTWPGNVRELENVIERLTIIHGGETLEDRHISTMLQPNLPALEQTHQTRDEAERCLIEDTLRKCHGIIGGPQGAARILGMQRTTLQYRIRKLCIDTAPFRTC
jgi:transcriptional regulator with GAF, ATPase, and Fis domain